MSDAIKLVQTSDLPIITMSASSLTVLCQEKLATDELKTEVNENKKIMTEAERLEARAKKFGDQLDTKKLEDRAKRFGTIANNTAVLVANDEALKKRAERFGTQLTSSAPSTPVSKEILEKRAKRFGTDSSQAETLTDNSTEKLNKRKERFGVVDDDSKKKLRMQRFGQTSS